MRFRGMSVAMVGAVTLLLSTAPEADAQRGRLGRLRPAPRPSLGGPLPRLGVIAPHFFTSCVVLPSVFPFFGGVPFVNVQVFANSQPSPDPTSHVVPDPNGQPVPFPGSHPLPSLQPVPGMHPVSGLVRTNPRAVPAYVAPVYSAPVYTAPVYNRATPVTTPHVAGGMVIGDVIVDPTFGLWAWSFFGGGVSCFPHRSVIIVR